MLQNGWNRRRSENLGSRFTGLNSVTMMTMLINNVFVLFLSNPVMRDPSDLLKTHQGQGWPGGRNLPRIFPNVLNLNLNLLWSCIQITWLISAHVIKLAALFQLLSNPRGHVSIFCWSYQPRFELTPAQKSFASHLRIFVHLHYGKKSKERQIVKARSNHMQRLFFTVSRWRNNPSFQFTHSHITCRCPGGSLWVRSMSLCSFYRRNEHCKCVRMILVQHSAANHEASTQFTEQLERFHIHRKSKRLKPQQCRGHILE